jgi:macrolide transport system ATP-binding/permease protein
MRRLRALFARMGGAFHSARSDAELREELESHLALETDEHIRRGLEPNDARRTALVAAGGVTLAAEAYREQRGLPVLDRLVQDLRFGLRILRRAPAFTIVAVGAIGLGVGINAGFFTLIDALMLQPLPVANPSRLVKMIGIDARGGANIRFSYPSFNTVAARASSIQDLVAYVATPIILRTSPAGHAAPASAGCVSGSYFGSLGGRAALGRLLGPSDDRDGAPPAIVISDALWERQFHRAIDVVGRDVVIDGVHATVVGVVSRDFIGINPLVPDLWIPVTLAARAGATPGQLRDPANRFLILHGRLREGVDRRRAESELSALVAEPHAMAGTMADMTRLTGVVLLPNDSTIPIVGETALAALPGFIIVLLVLVIACANLANLLLSRALVRQREIAVRLAIGASRGRLVRQLLTESLLIAVLGAVLGLLLARVTVSVMMRSFLAAVPTTFGTVNLRIEPSWRVFVYTIGLTIGSTLLFGLAPALQASARDLASALKGEDSLFGTHIRRSRLRDLLVSAQVAACLVLLAAAATLVQSLRNFATVETRLNVRPVMVAHIGLAAIGHVSPTLAGVRSKFAERVTALDGVAAAAVVLAPPGTPWPVLHVADVAHRDKLRGILSNVITPRYFDVVGQRILGGRPFAADDSAPGARVAIVSAAAARMLWPGGPALGQSLFLASTGDSAGRLVRVVGVVADARSGMAWDNDANGYLYLPASSVDLATRDMSVLVRGNGAVRDLARPIADIGRQLDPDEPVTTNRLVDLFSLQLLPYQYSALVASGVGALGMLLAILGLYGVVAFAVTQRQREIAIHVAMGAAPPDVLGLVLRREIGLVLRGVAVGLVLALGEAKLLGSIVLPLSPLSVWSVIALGAGLVVVAVVATLVPGLGALRIAPMQVLRQE